MPSMDEIKKYSATVCEQVRWKKVHPMIAQEIEDHLCDQRDCYRSEGEEEELATLHAIEEMGDAVTVGVQLDKTHKPRPQWVMILLTLTLMLVGTGVRCFTDTSGAAMERFPFLSLGVAIVIFFAAYFLDFTVLGKYPRACYIIVLLFSIVALMSSTQVNARAFWVAIPGLSLSLAYLSLIFPLIYALFIYAMRNKGIKGILLCGISYIPYAIILLLVPSATGFLVYTLSALVTLCIAITRGWFGTGIKQGLIIVLAPTILLMGAVLCCLGFQTYRLERIQVMLDPYPNPNGYQYVMIRELISGAVFFGKGTVPEQYGDILSAPWFNTDMQLTVLTNTHGWGILLGIFLLFVAFSAIAIYKVSRQKSVLGLIVSLPILLVFIMQVILYIASNLGYGLLTALSLPLISYGRAALFLNAVLIGFMLSVFRTGDSLRDNFKVTVKRTPFVVYEDGKLIINLK